MGSLWLRNLPEVLAGLPNLSFYQGWENRARNAGGYDKLLGVVVHHTASQTTTERDCAYQWVNAKDRPIGAMYIGRAGEIVVGAAGATNCQGLGGPRNCSKGTIPKDRGNSNAFAIEAGNNGIGEPWPEAQQNAYIAVIQRLIAGYGLAVADTFSHHEWTPTRKIDAAGPSRFGSINSSGTWNMDLFRGEVAGAPPTVPPIPPEPTPVPPKPPQEDWMANLPTIKKGDQGAYVERMQHLLAAAGFMNPANTANYDGVWGNGTETAKVNFDNAHGLAPSPPTDCGPKSWESLMTGRVW